MEGERKHICSSCKTSKPINWKVFKIDKTGKYSKTCKSCQARKAKKIAETENKENDEDVELSVLPLSELTHLLEEINVTEELEAMVDIDPIVEHTSPSFNLKKHDFDAEEHLSVWAAEFRKQADEIAKLVWKTTDYRYLYQSSTTKGKECGIHFHYHCAQLKERQHASKKSAKEGVKKRDKAQMPTFDCNGWLHVFLTIENPNIAEVKITHRLYHVPYFQISVPVDVKEFIEARKDWSFAKVWSAIIEDNPTPPFSRKACANIWQKINSEEYRRDDDELTSAKKLLQEFRASKDERYRAEEVNLPPLEGFTGISFVLTYFLKIFQSIIREISLDSTWNTNGLNYECFALLGEVHGSGCPLGYLLVHVSGGVKHGKEEYIARLLRYVKEVWNISPKVTLTDKDWSEIDACREVFPDSEHQLCYWHVLRAIKQRLAVVKRRPRYYDVEEAKSLFEFVDPLFVPIGQLDPADLDKVDTWVASEPLPRLTILQGGVVRSTAPVLRPPTPLPSTQPPTQRRKLIVRHQGKVVLAADIEGEDDPDEPEDEVDERNEDAVPLVDVDDVDADADVLEEDGEAMQLLERRFGKGIEEDNLNEKEGMYEEGEKRTNDPSYHFCPAIHRMGVMRLVTRHFVQHPIFPQRGGEQWDSERIYRESVYEAYTYCHQRGLREVWGYLWANWYSPKRWKLWARSGKPFLSRLRTTMNVENFWRQIKHRYLHDYTRPRLDHLVWILIKTVTPRYFEQLNRLDDSYRMGRTKALSWAESSLKRHWRKLEGATVSEKEYHVNVKGWTCTCGQPKYEAHHLCKHLVQAVQPPPPPSFFQEVYRRRVAPLYKHRLLDPDLDYDDLEYGSITDGDDKKIYGSKQKVFESEKWKDVLKPRKTVKRTSVSTAQDVVSGKRRRTEGSAETSTSNTAPPSASTTPPPPEAELSEPADTHMSSPGTFGGASEPDYASSEAYSRVTTPLSHSEDERTLEEEREDLVEFLKTTSQALKEASSLIDEQLALPGGPSDLWMRGLKNRNFGRDAKKFVSDVRKLTKTGRKRRSTMGSRMEKGSSSRVANTIGYRFPFGEDNDDEAEEDGGEEEGRLHAATSAPST